MNYNSDVQNTQNTENFSYTPYMIKPSNSNSSGYVSYIDLLKFGQVTDFGYLQGYRSFSVYMGKFYSFDS